jgi:hypothetical protein
MLALAVVFSSRQTFLGLYQVFGFLRSRCFFIRTYTLVTRRDSRVVLPPLRAAGILDVLLFYKVICYISTQPEGLAIAN